MGKMDNVLNFRVDDEFRSWLGEVLTEMPNLDLSKLIRVSLPLAVPLLKEYPDLVKTIAPRCRGCQ